MRQYLIILFALIASVAVAQPKLHHEEMYIGLRAGATASMMRFYPATGIYQQPLQSHLGITGGAAFRYIGHKVCGLQVEVNYTQKGWNETASSEDKSIVYQRQLDFIQVPLLCHLYFGKRFRGFLNLGPQVGYLLDDNSQISIFPSQVSSAEKNSQIPDANSPSSASDRFGSASSRFDYGIAGGLGFYGRAPHAGTFQLEARFEYSLSSVFPHSNLDYFRGANPMTLSLTFSYFWQFHGER